MKGQLEKAQTTIVDNNNTKMHMTTMGIKRQNSDLKALHS